MGTVDSAVALLTALPPALTALPQLTTLLKSAAGVTCVAPSPSKPSALPPPSFSSPAAAAPPPSSSSLAPSSPCALLSSAAAAAAPLTPSLTALLPPSSLFCWIVSYLYPN